MLLVLDSKAPVAAKHDFCRWEIRKGASEHHKQLEDLRKRASRESLDVCTCPAALLPCLKKRQI